MSTRLRASGLQIEEDLRHQRAEWIVERVAWALFAVTILFAVLGLFGGGVMSTAIARSGSGSVALEYERFARRGAPGTLTVHVAGSVVRGSHLRLRVARPYLSRVEIESVTPAPDSELLEGDWLTYTFLVVPSARFVIALEVKPAKAGVSRGRLAIGDDQLLEYWQLVYP